MEEVAEQTVASESLSRSRSPSSPIPWAESMGCEEGEAKDSSNGVTSSSRLLRGSLVLDCLVAVYYTDDHHEEGEED